MPVKFRIAQKLKILFFGTITLLFVSVGLAQPPAHDPSAMIQNVDGRYWVFTTGNGVSALSASDKEWNNWRFEKPVFPNAHPSWINSIVSDFEGHFWAPDVIRMNGAFYIYYSASSWGTTRSAIGVARTTDLSKPFTDLGKVISSNGSSSERNAIDPALFRDNDGRVWMSYGSFFGGIGVVEIDTLTGKTKGSVTTIAGGNHQDIEAPYITRNGDYYYLFVNRGACCKGLESTYYMMVARSSNVKGPYSGWKTFLRSEDRFHGPGHVGLGEGVFTYHFYDRESNGAARMSVSSISWVDGWPVAGTPQAWDQAEGASIDEGFYRLNVQHSNMALEVANNNPYEGANVQQGTPADEDGQVWFLDKVADNWYKISPKANTRLALDVHNVSTRDGANIMLWSYWGGEGQQWKFEAVRDDYYHIVARNSRKCLQVVSALSADRANVEQFQCDEQAENQLFKLSDPTLTDKEAFEQLSGLLAVPNPASSHISIVGSDTFNGDFELSVYNTMGQKVMHLPSLSQHKNYINIERLPAGIYTIEAIQDQHVQTLRFIKQ
ncbi:family 43 glycosylhydrolase [Roseimarinus sediminis]|uniref:family 43 glycosylhydrolase n=1 Tax=Roseimarinus sediminis TaxID=1610899 RepID=UPI003D248135